MDLDLVWTDFLRELRSQDKIENLSSRTYSGFPFLYVKTPLSRNELEHLLKEAAGLVMKGKQLHADLVYVRTFAQTYVYRVRFYVPLRKMFCCGNGCIDCIRFST
ncbi:hypothetical protein P4641_15630 [Halalkalibacterium halodurans]|uniref:hypothetical protein n=1 Tax=Halalkalibacterium halodurans TaxID=86665 RepID=UPI002E1D1CBD|nr:hypothetical protein [Halalkalibacterium halodurans]